MKKLSYLILGLFLVNISYSQIILNVPEITQEQDQWCWAGVSKCILDYYCYSFEQCEIAEYARQVITWHSFGYTDCCENPNVGCNYWNYNWGYPGSIQDILIHFGSIQNSGTGCLSQAAVISELSAGRPFVIRWGWNAGGGHFIVGHGIDDNNLHYMDPWFGEGFHIATYDWVVNDGNHTWTHTNVLTTNPPSTPCGSLTITATAGNNGNINPEGTISITAGDSQTFTATPNNCYEINEWKVNGNVVQTGGDSYTVTDIQENTIIHVTFKIKTFTITPSADIGGSISPNTIQTVDCGNGKTFTATPENCYEINEWKVNDNVVQTGGDSYTVINIQENTTIHVTFKIKTFTITPSADTGGSISPNTIQTVDCGNDKTFTAIPENYYEINEWKVNGNVVQTGGDSYTVTNIQENTTINITFSPLIGINEKVSRKTQVYPNPTKNEVFIKSELPIHIVEVYSILGALLLTENNFKEKISISDLEKGVYILKIYTGNNIVIHKIIKE